MQGPCGYVLHAVHCPAPPTLRHPGPSSSIDDEFEKKLREMVTCKGATIGKSFLKKLSPAWTNGGYMDLGSI